VVLGPYAGQMLGDLGADVVKIESLQGDPMRAVGPSQAEQTAGLGALFLGCNRNKRSLAVDLNHPEGRAAALAVVGKADVLLHNFRPASIARLGFDYPRLRRINPSLVHCATFGYAEAGPYGGRGAYDDSVQGASGLAWLNRDAEGTPRYLPTIVADKTTALVVVQAVLAALFHRQRTGEGQCVEVPMFETMAGWVMVEHLWGQSWAPPRGECGYPRVLSPDRRPYRTSDGHYLSVLPYTDRHWQEFWTLAGDAAKAGDPRFGSVADRLGHIDDCYHAIAQAIARQPLDFWLEALGASSVPFVPVNSPDGLLGDPHLVATGFWRELDHPRHGRMRFPAPPAELSATPADIRLPPPELGEHSREVLQEAGLGAAEIDHLVADGVVRLGGSEQGGGHG